MFKKILIGLVLVVLGTAQLQAAITPPIYGPMLSEQDTNDQAGNNKAPPKDKNSNAPTCDSAGGMIQLVNGSERFSITDLELNGLFPIRMTRQYESRATYDSAVGFGWDFSFVRRLYVYNDQDKDIFQDSAKDQVYEVKHHVIRHGCGRKDLWISYQTKVCTPELVNIVEGDTPESTKVNQPVAKRFYLAGGGGGGGGGGVDLWYPQPYSACVQNFYKANGSLSNIYRQVSFQEVSEGIVNFFDAEGRLTERRDDKGNSHRYTYDARGLLPMVGSPAKGVDVTRPRVVAKDYRLTHIEEYAADGASTGNWVDLTYNESTGRLTQLTASDGRVVIYTHDVTADGLTLGNLLRVDAPGDKVSNYKYEDANDLHNITSIQEDANESPWVNTYNADDRAIKQVRELGDGRYAHINVDFTNLYSQTTVRKSLRDAVNNILPGTTESVETTWFDAMWMKSTYFEDANGHCIANVYDANGNGSQKDYYAETCTTVKAGSATAVKTVETTYDKYGRLLSEKIHLADGGYKTQEWLFDPIETGVAAFTVGSTAAVKDGASHNPGLTRTVQLDNSASTEQPAADIFYGNNAGFTADNTAIADPVATPGFYASHLTNTVLQKSGNSSNPVLYDLVTQLHYDTKNRLASVIQDGHEIRASYEAGSLFPTRVAHLNTDSSEDPTQLMRYAYDARGNLSDKWDGKNNHTHYEYDDRNRVINITNARNEQTILTYTGKYLTRVEIGHTATANGLIRQFGYDGHGNLSKVEEQDDNGIFHTVFSGSYDGMGHLLTATDGANHTWQYQYDNAGNLVREEDPEHHVTEHGYDAVHNRSWTRDAKLQLTNYGYDGADRLIRIEQCGVSPCAVTTIEYDGSDRVVAVIDANNNRSSYTYDLAGRLRAESGAKGTQTYNYDNRNRLVQWLNARGQKTTYDYYPWGGLATASYYPDATATTATRRVSRTYDLQGNPQGITDDAIQTALLRNQQYDALNRLATEYNFHVPGKTISKTYHYDALGNIKTLGINDGSSLNQSYTYNRRNWLDTAQLLSSAYAFTYYNDGREHTRTQSARKRSQSYYSNGWLQNITDSVSSSAQLTQGFTPDAVGNIDAINRIIGSQSETNSYGYDGLNRVTSASNPAITGINANESYNYDGTGNRDAFTYDAWNKLNTALGKSYTYDADGNPNNIGGITLAHDADGRMTQYGSNSYTYDPEWRRIKKTTANGTRYYVWEGERLLAEYDATGTRIARYAYLPNDYSPSEVDINGQVYQVRSDHLGTPLELVNASNQTVWRAHYESFGKAVIEDDVDGDGNHVEFNVRMPGQYYDLESGLSYNLHRYYDPQTGRYMTSDPIGLVAGVNTYAYVENNPLRFIDPLGLMSGRPPVLPPDVVLPKPRNLPNWPTKPSNKGGGEQCVNPKNPHEKIRIMPGNPKSPNPAQQQPYVKYQKDGKFYDKNGNPVDGKSPESHIPTQEFNWPMSAPPSVPYPGLPSEHPANQII